MKIGMLFLVGLFLNIGQNICFAGPKLAKKIMVVVFENTDFEDTWQKPHFKALANQGGLLTNLFATTHPSEPNYIALTSGSTYGVWTDGNYDLDVKHIGDLVEASGKSWKAYLEGYPGQCFLGSSNGKYVRKHNPFMSYKNISQNKQRCNEHLFGSGQLDEDIKNGVMPDFSLFVPDMDDDGHDTGVGYADKYLANFLDRFKTNPKIFEDLLVVITFDEGSYARNNRIYTALFGAGVIPASHSAQRLSHYSILNLVEEILGLGYLTNSDRDAYKIDGIWQ